MWQVFTLERKFHMPILLIWLGHVSKRSGIQHPWWWWRQWHVMSTKFSHSCARENVEKLVMRNGIVVVAAVVIERENLSKCFTITSSIIKSTFGNYFPRNLMSMWCGGVVVCCWVHLLNIALSNAAHTNK